jgi:hypothetical protein
VAVVAEAAAIAVLAGVRLLGRTQGGVVAARPRRSPPSGLRPLVPNNGRPGPGGGGPRVAGLDAPASCGCPHAAGGRPPHRRRGIDRAAGAEQQSAGAGRSHVGPGEAGCARASTRPVPAPASTAIGSDAQVGAETQLGHGVQQDVLLALATRSLIADLWCGASTARQLWDPRRVGLFSGVRRGATRGGGRSPRARRLLWPELLGRARGARASAPKVVGVAPNDQELVAGPRRTTRPPIG